MPLEIPPLRPASSKQVLPQSSLLAKSAAHGQSPFKSNPVRGQAVPLRDVSHLNPRPTGMLCCPPATRVFVSPSYPSYSRECHAIFSPSPLWDSIFTLFAASSEIIAGLCLCISFLSLNDEVFPRALSTK